MNVACAVLWFGSDAIQVTVVVPTGNIVPDDGVLLTGTIPATASHAETL